MTNDAKEFAYTNQELSALAPVIEISCVNASKKVTELKRNSVSPMESVSFDARIELNQCVRKSMKQVNENCREEFQAYHDCIGHKLRKPLRECFSLYQTLQKCAAKNKIGEMETM